MSLTVYGDQRNVVRISLFTGLLSNILYPYVGRVQVQSITDGGRDLIPRDLPFKRKNNNRNNSLTECHEYISTVIYNGFCCINLLDDYHLYSELFSCLFHSARQLERTLDIPLISQRLPKHRKSKVLFIHVYLVD